MVNKCPHCGKTLSEDEKIKFICFYCGKELFPKAKPTVQCVYCKSTNTKKITTSSKVKNIALWGIFGNKRRKQWHCNNCTSDF